MCSSDLPEPNRRGIAENGWPAESRPISARESPARCKGRHSPYIGQISGSCYKTLSRRNSSAFKREKHAARPVRSFSPAPARRPRRASAEAHPMRLRRMRRFAPIQCAAPGGSGLMCASPSGRLPSTRPCAFFGDFAARLPHYASRSPVHTRTAVSRIWLGPLVAMRPRACSLPRNPAAPSPSTIPHTGTTEIGRAHV